MDGPTQHWPCLLPRFNGCHTYFLPLNAHSDPAVDGITLAVMPTLNMHQLLLNLKEDLNSRTDIVLPKCHSQKIGFGTNVSSMDHFSKTAA
jgi:hypothetical protein